MIVNDATSWSITLESSIMLLESSIMLLENIYSTRITHGDRNMFILEAPGLCSIPDVSLKMHLENPAVQ